jgi:hypothetical protein
MVPIAFPLMPTLANTSGSLVSLSTTLAEIVRFWAPATEENRQRKMINIRGIFVVWKHRPALVKRVVKDTILNVILSGSFIAKITALTLVSTFRRK